MLCVRCSCSFSSYAVRGPEPWLWWPCVKIKGSSMEEYPPSIAFCESVIFPEGLCSIAYSIKATKFYIYEQPTPCLWSQKGFGCRLYGLISPYLHISYDWYTIVSGLKGKHSNQLKLNRQKKCFSFKIRKWIKLNLKHWNPLILW